MTLACVTTLPGISYLNCHFLCISLFPGWDICLSETYFWDSLNCLNTSYSVSLYFHFFFFQRHCTSRDSVLSTSLFHSVLCFIKYVVIDMLCQVLMRLSNIYLNLNTSAANTPCCALFMQIFSCTECFMYTICSL